MAYNPTKISYKIATRISEMSIQNTLDTTVAPETRIARAVVLRGMQDALNISMEVYNNRALAVADGKRFMNDSEELRIWCEIAEWNKDYILRKYRSIQ